MFTLRQLLLAIAMAAAASPSSAQLIIAHRGASYDAPENTLAAFRLAITQGADGFEGDYWLGRDGRLMCLHDKDTDRVAVKKLCVTTASFKSLRSLDVGKWKGGKWCCERMPTFNESLAVLPENKKFFIELKSGAEIVKPLARAIKRSEVPTEQLVIISFDAQAIAASKKEMPDIKALWLCSYQQKEGQKPPPTVEETAATLKRIKADGLNAEAVPKVVNAKFIKRLAELGYKEFGVWTVDDPKVARFYQKLGASAITTNRPGWLREQLEKPEKKDDANAKTSSKKKKKSDRKRRQSE
jgi:glycerophosphoryl diester phosphodiesterase